MRDIDKIIEVSGATPNECSCSKCAQMCRRSPCLGTPQEILNLMNAGYMDNLIPTTWAAGLQWGLPLIDMVQIRMNEKTGHCSLLTADNKCMLHGTGLKPSEGVLATCNPIIGIQHKHSPSKVVGATWHIEAGPEFSKTRKVVMNGYLKYFNSCKK